ncbi:MAG: PASTA domain-containing protein [bacterium]|nr:PASTA domain-containing protein [bacterium]
MRLRLILPRFGPSRRPGKPLDAGERPSRWRQAAALVLWLTAGGVLCGVVFVASFYMAMRIEMSSTEVRVPDLAGLTLEEAGVAVEPQELVLQVVEQRNDPAVASGRVIQQVPPPQASVRRGRKIKLVMSLGGRIIPVPDMVGQASRALEIELRQQGLAPGEEAHAPSRAIPAGRVVAQVPPPGTPTVPNTRVHRLVSTGPADVAWVMPDLTGINRKVAESWVESSGFRRGTVRRVRMSRQPAGTVVGQLPLAGYPIRAKDVVELTIAD